MSAKKISSHFDKGGVHANALCEATAKFEIFPNWFGSFSGLI
jgi:hypothetical protein